MTEMTIKETIHHGDYYNVRTVTIQDAAYDDFFDEVRKTCPYLPHGDSSNHFERLCWDDLVNTGKGSIGWCRYEPCRLACPCDNSQSVPRNFVLVTRRPYIRAL